MVAGEPRVILIDARWGSERSRAFVLYYRLSDTKNSGGHTSGLAECIMEDPF